MDRNGAAAIVAASGLGFVLGSVHAFSVFLEPLEHAFQATRANVALCYSIALVAITASVSFGHRVYPRLPGWGIAVAVSGLSLIGIWIAGTATGLVGVWLGYGLLFGLANGLGYGYGLQLSAQYNPGREGLAMGIMTAAYALGATVFPLWFASALDNGGFAAAMQVLGAALVIAGLGSGALMAAFGLRFKGAKARSAGPVRGTARLWLAYGSAVLAGLMATGHATAIAGQAGLAPGLLIAAPMVLAICNMAGSLGGGWLADRIAARPLLAGLPVMSAIALIALALDLIPGALAGLGVIGLVYGAVISVYPAVIARRHGVALGVAVYGRVFTAWAVAGLSGPWIAGALFDQTGDYALPLALAAGLSLVSALVVLTGSGRRDTPPNERLDP